MKKIVYTAADGATHIIHPAPIEHVARVLPQVSGMLEQEYVNFIRSKDVPNDATNVRVVDESEIPADRAFRNAWKHDLTHDMAKCVEITNQRLRAEREPLMAKLDIDAVRALSSKGDVAAIEKEKQRLRDITKIAHAGMTLDELKAIKC